MHRAAARCQENFYPRPPRGGRRPPSRIWRWSWSFLSTPSARRATVVTSAGSSLEPIFLSTPSARRATLAVLVESVKPLAEFLSTPSARRATFPYGRRRRYKRISIHALREEGDPAARLRQPERHISIHALREEGDHGPHCCAGERCTYFYPRPPRGGRLHKPLPVTSAALTFLSTPSARRATRPVCLPKFYPFYFYPRPPRGGRPVTGWTAGTAAQFLSTPSARRATRKM